MGKKQLRKLEKKNEQIQQMNDFKASYFKDLYERNIKIIEILSIITSDTSQMECKIPKEIILLILSFINYPTQLLCKNLCKDYLKKEEKDCLDHLKNLCSVGTFEMKFEYQEEDSECQVIDKGLYFSKMNYKSLNLKFENCELISDKRTILSKLDSLSNHAKYYKKWRDDPTSTKEKKCLQETSKLMDKIFSHKTIMIVEKDRNGISEFYINFNGSVCIKFFEK